MQCIQVLLRGCTSQVGAWAEIASPYQTSRPGTHGHCWRGTAGCSTTSDVSIWCEQQASIQTILATLSALWHKRQTASAASICCLHKVNFPSNPARDLLSRGKVVGHLLQPGRGFNHGGAPWWAPKQAIWSPQRFCSWRLPVLWHRPGSGHLPALVSALHALLHRPSARL